MESKLERVNLEDNVIIFFLLFRSRGIKKITNEIGILDIISSMYNGWEFYLEKAV